MPVSKPKQTMIDLYWQKQKGKRQQWQTSNEHDFKSVCDKSVSPIVNKKRLVYSPLSVEKQREKSHQEKRQHSKESSKKMNQVVGIPLKMPVLN